MYEMLEALNVIMLDIVIVDDEKLARDRLKRMLETLGYEVSAEAENAEQALAVIAKYDPSVVLLDIEMPGETGLAVAEKIGQLELPPAVIFTTAYDQYALDAFDAFATGYLLKPINREELKQAIDKAGTITKMQLSTLSANDSSHIADHLSTTNHEADTASPPKHITVHSHRGVDLVSVESIRYFIADNKYITAVGTEGETLIDGTLKEYEQLFSGQFVRIHRNAIISIDHIVGLQRAPEGHYTVRLRDIDTQPTISRRYVSKIKGLLDSL